MVATASRNLTQFARERRLQGLTPRSLEAVRESRHGYSVRKARRFLAFHRRIGRELLGHRIITDNRYTAWFRKGEQTLPQIRAFIVQFSVFSNQFLIAQLQKTINADSLAGMRASKEILANEIGVVFKPPRRAAPASADTADPALLSTQGSVEGGIFRFRAAHFEWLLATAAAAGLRFDEMGRREHGTSPTLFFCDELIRLYGSEDYMTSQAASFAVENWAAAGFWDELVEGFEKFNERMGAKLPLAFFSWHGRLEGQHAEHTRDELEALYFSRQIDEERFIHHGSRMLDGVAAFWDGLDEQRRALPRRGHK